MLRNRFGVIVVLCLSAQRKGIDYDNEENIMLNYGICNAFFDKSAERICGRGKNDYRKRGYNASEQ